MNQICVQCGKALDDGYTPFCDCGGFTEARYDLHAVKLRDSPNPYLRFADLLPVKDVTLLPHDAGYSPTVHAQALGAHLGMKWLYLKNETVWPTRTTKDRMAAVALPFLFEAGVRSFCTSSTGNSSTAYARAVRAFPEMQIYLFTAESFVDRVQEADHQQIKHFGLRGATFVEAFDCAAVYAGAHGLVSERGFFNIGRREGLKLAFLEATEQVPRPINWYVQAVSSAMGVWGTYKGAKELRALGRIERLPKLLCVQQETCAPMVNAFHEGSATIQSQHIVAHPDGIAEAILRGNPSRVYPFVRQIVLESGGDFVAVSEQGIREAHRMVAELEGIVVCYSAAAAVAGLIKQVRSKLVPIEDTVMINLTGGQRTGPLPRIVLWLRRENDRWIEE